MIHSTKRVLPQGDDELAFLEYLAEERMLYPLQLGILGVHTHMHHCTLQLDAAQEVTDPFCG